MHKLDVLLVCSALLLSACGATRNIDKGTAGWIGAGAGALIGGWAGSNFGGGTGEIIFTGIGAIFGSAVGYETGRSLALADRGPYSNAVNDALDNQYGHADWQNEATGTGGYVKAGHSFNQPNGQSCQTYRATVAFTDEVMSGEGAACRNKSGEWVLVADAFR